MIIVILITILVICFSIASFIANCGYDNEEKMGVAKLGKKMGDKISYKIVTLCLFIFSSYNKNKWSCKW